MATSASRTATASWSTAELAEQPCQALTDEDIAALDAYDTSEEDMDGDLSCRWGLPGWLVSFTAYPTVDHTADPHNQDLNPTVIAGRMALAGYRLNGPACIMYVATGSGQSFRLHITRFSNAYTEDHSCDVAIKVATAIVPHIID